MSVTKLKEDLDFGKNGEDEFKAVAEKFGWKIEKTDNPMDILDFSIVDKHGNKIWLEQKTRRCSKGQYDDTMIGLNKLIEAYKRYDKEGLYTLFVFKFTDGIYYINPFFSLPRFDYRRGRWDRGDIDGQKGWIYYSTEELLLIKQLSDGVPLKISK